MRNRTSAVIGRSPEMIYMGITVIYRFDYTMLISGV
jgi:hypothetical protein